MPEYTQANRALRITTPLGPDALLIAGLEGREALSQLFHFELDLLAKNGQDIAFDKVVGQKAVVSLAVGGGKFRYFAGIVSQLSQGLRDSTMTHYRAELAPQFWLLTHRRQSRVFQQVSVPDILKQVLGGLDVVFKLVGTFHPRDYCVQYRESDFAFASRLMEEEGICYFFRHDADGHTMVLSNSPGSHPMVPPGKLVFDENTNQTHSSGGITQWEKVQQLRPRTYTLWDHCFELPQQSLVATGAIAETMAVGSVSHKLKLAANDKLEVYEYPGAYAQRFDGITRSGGEQPASLRKIFEDNERTVKIRMEAETVPGLFIRGASYAREIVSGYKFTLSRHFNADGTYLLTSVQHHARYADDYRSGETAPFEYQNHFTCIPADMPFRPLQVTPKPVIGGMQTALVVGPPGETSYCDKYGRVKVQFYWDRQGKKNADSSCWIRVGQASAGQGYGTLHLPRIGHEVIVGFLEGDPDQPIITGVVYNADNMPPYKLPDQRTFSGVVHRSHHGVAKNASEIRFQDQLGSELLLVHAETDSMQQAENNHLLQVGNVHRHEVGHFYHTIVGKPVDVNKAGVGSQGGASGSGAGGGKGGGGTTPQGSAPGQGTSTTTILPDGAEQDTYPSPGLETDINGNNTTNITGDDTYTCNGTARSEIDQDNHTVIEGIDFYRAANQVSVVIGAVTSAVGGGVISYESNLLDVVGELKLEFSGLIHVDFALSKAAFDGLATNSQYLKLYTLG